MIQIHFFKKGLMYHQAQKELRNTLKTTKVNKKTTIFDQYNIQLQQSWGSPE